MTSVPPGGSYTPPPPPSGSAAPGSDRTIMVVLSYISILALIPLLTKKDDREVQWHAKNGIVLAGAEIVTVIVFFVIGIALRNTGILGCGLGAIECVICI